MSSSPLYKFKVDIISDEVITFGTIIRSPRIYKPLDLQAARQNLRIIPENGESSPNVEALVNYVLTDFFVLLHRTGLYNRQRRLWEALSRVAVVKVFQLKGGVFKNKLLPVFDIQFLDYRERQLLICRFMESADSVEDKISLRLLKSFIAQSAKVPGLLGVFWASMGSVSENIRQHVSKLTEADDPVGRYESLLPRPMRIPMDLLESTKEQTANNNNNKFQLVHPNLTSSKRSYASTSGLAGTTG